MLLNLHSFYSLRYGTLPLEGLPELLRSYGYTAAVLTDINNSTGALEWINLCQKANFQGLAGMEMRQGDELLYICIARNNEGFAEINELRSTCTLAGRPLPARAPHYWQHVYVIYPCLSPLWQQLSPSQTAGISRPSPSLPTASKPETTCRPKLILAISKPRRRARKVMQPPAPLLRKGAGAEAFATARASVLSHPGGGAVAGAAPATPVSSSNHSHVPPLHHPASGAGQGGPERKLLPATALSRPGPQPARRLSAKKPAQPPLSLLPHEFLGVQASHLPKIILGPRHLREKYVVWQPSTFPDQRGYLLHRQLRAIHHNTLLSQLQPEHCASPAHILLPQAQLLRPFQDFPHIIKNTENLFAHCSFSFDFKTVKNRRTFTGTSYDDQQLLEKLAYDGCRERYGTHHKTALARVKKELAIIHKLGFSAYFLITWDVIRYSMHRGFYHVGRGSGANSVVAYCLHITDVCPIELDLYFERFLNPKRKSPPDFDIDYSWRDRDEVFGYIFKRYGSKHTAMLGAMSTFRDRSILRELGKVYGLPKAEIDKLVHAPPPPEQLYTSAQTGTFGSPYPGNHENPTRPETMGPSGSPSAAGRGPQRLPPNEITALILSVYTQMADFPNLRTIHAGGVLISELPLSNYVALDLPPKGFATVQFDMYTAEEAGFEKLDILSQRGIGHIKECADVVLANRGHKIDVHNVAAFKKDPAVAAQLKKGDTIGCFYIESPAMRGLLKKLHCSDYLTLVAASSIIRPGVAKSGMMKEYIYRFHHPEKFSYLHPVMEQQLQETRGVMVYQEDVLKIGHHYGGLDLADADVLRRLMSGKNRGRHHLAEIEAKFFSNCAAKGYPEATTREVWRQIESFAGYSFSKAHSASYAVESYQSLYLKTYYPLEFMVAVINNFGGFYKTFAYVNEAQKCGGTLHLPCVNRSVVATSITGSDIYLGFQHVQNLEKNLQEKLVLQRSASGPFTSLQDVQRRTGAGLEQLVVLIRVGALRFTGLGKKALLWEAHSLLGKLPPRKQETQLFQEDAQMYELPPLHSHALEDAYDEIELLGYPLSQSLFDLAKTSYRGNTVTTELMDKVGQTVRLVGNYVAAKHVRTTKGTIMNFGTWLDVNGDFFDTIHFPPSLARYPFKGMGAYLLEGKVVQEFGFPGIEISKMDRLPVRPDPRSE